MKEEKLSAWPFFWGFLLYTVGNVDYVVIPFILEPSGFSFWETFLIAAPLANLEVIGGFYFWSWITWKWLPTMEPIKGTVELTKNIITLLREYGLLGMITFKVGETFRWATNGRFSRFVNAWGHVGMFVLGAESFVSGGRLVGTIICASTKWKNGLYSLIIGNIIHIAIAVGAWKLFFFLWGEHKEELILSGIFMFLFVVGGFVQRKLRDGQALLKSP